MKSISFDQLKTMLKSMSYPIFTRIGRAEKNVQNLTDQVSDLKTQIPTKPKKIIFRQNSSNEYTCDLTFNDLWEMEPEQIASNTILIDRYGIEKTARSARKSGSVKSGIRNIQIDIDGNFEADMVTYFKQTLIIDWWAHGDVAVITAKTASSLSDQKIGAVDVPNVPILRAGNWENYAIGPGLKVDAVASTPTLEINAGEGLEVVGDALRVKPEGEWKLINEITLNEEVPEIVLNNLNLCAVMLRAEFPPSNRTGNITIYYTFQDWRKGLTSFFMQPFSENNIKYGFSKCWAENGRYKTGWWTSVAGPGVVAAYTENPFGLEEYNLRDNAISEVKMVFSQNMPIGTKIEVEGIDYNA